ITAFPVHDGCIEDRARSEHEVASEHLFKDTGGRRNRSQEDQITPVGGKPEAPGTAHINVLRIARRIERIPLSRSRTWNATQNNEQQHESAKTIVALHVRLL